MGLGLDPGGASRFPGPGAGGGRGGRVGGVDGSAEIGSEPTRWTRKSGRSRRGGRGNRVGGCGDDADLGSEPASWVTPAGSGPASACGIRGRSPPPRPGSRVGPCARVRGSRVGPRVRRSGSRVGPGEGEADFGTWWAGRGGRVGSEPAGSVSVVGSDPIRSVRRKSRTLRGRCAGRVRPCERVAEDACWPGGSGRCSAAEATRVMRASGSWRAAWLALGGVRTGAAAVRGERGAGLRSRSVMRWRAATRAAGWRRHDRGARRPP